MAISINKVYRTTLSIVNKEQRGFVTPDNIAKIGAQVQTSILDDNLAEYRNLINQRSQYRHADGYGDLVNLYQEKIDAFLTTANTTATDGVISMPSSAYKLLGVYSIDRLTKYEEITRGKLNYLLSSPLTAPSSDFPIYYKNNSNENLTLVPSITGSLSVDYLRFPVSPRWGYTENTSNGAYIYDPNPYLEGRLIIKQNAFSGFTTNISGGTDGTYVDVDATINGGVETIPLTVIVSGGVVTRVDVTTATSGLSIGDTLTVAASDLGVGGLSSDLLITIAATDLYEGSTAGSIDFELHPSDETRLIIDILAYMGIVIRDSTISQIAGSVSQTKEILKQG